MNAYTIILRDSVKHGIKKAKNKTTFSDNVVSKRINMSGKNRTRRDAARNGRYFIQWDLTTSITSSSFSLP
jgi:hypothetical protein